MNETTTADYFSFNPCLYDNFSFPLFFGVILLAALFGLDIATTNMILLLGGYEQNAIMALIVNYPIIHIAVKIHAIIFIALVVWFSEYKIKGSGLVTLFILILFYSFVIYNNGTVLLGLIHIR